MAGKLKESWQIPEMASRRGTDLKRCKGRIAGIAGTPERRNDGTPERRNRPIAQRNAAEGIIITDSQTHYG